MVYQSNYDFLTLCTRLNKEKKTRNWPWQRQNMQCIPSLDWAHWVPFMNELHLFSAIPFCRTTLLPLFQLPLQSLSSISPTQPHPLLFFVSFGEEPRLLCSNLMCPLCILMSVYCMLERTVTVSHKSRRCKLLTSGIRGSKDWKQGP